MCVRMHVRVCVCVCECTCVSSRAHVLVLQHVKCARAASVSFLCSVCSRSSSSSSSSSSPCSSAASGHWGPAPLSCLKRSPRRCSHPCGSPDLRHTSDPRIGSRSPLGTGTSACRAARGGTWTTTQNAGSKCILHKLQHKPRALSGEVREPQGLLQSLPDNVQKEPSV